MKTTIDLHNEILKDAKKAAAIRGETLSDFVVSAIKARLRRETQHTRSRLGWRSVFGLARRDDVALVDQIVARDLETTESED